MISLSTGASSSTLLHSQDQADPLAKGVARFEVASIRVVPEKDVVPIWGSPISPSGSGVFTMHEITLPSVIAWAFLLDQDRLSGKESWMDREHFDISAKPEGDAGFSYDQLRPLMQQLLRDRFHLAYHRETQSRKGYALVIAKGGTKLTPAEGGMTNGFILADQIQMQNASPKDLASMLSHVLNEPVADETGLLGSYEVKLNFAPLTMSESSLPSVFTALEEQLGLKLQRGNVPVEMFVIEHVDRLPAHDD